MFGWSLPPIGCRRGSCLIMMFGSSLPPVDCRRGSCLIMMFGSYLSPVVCMRGSCLIMMFGSSLPPVGCRRGSCIIMMFGSSLPPVGCRRAHVLFMLVVGGLMSYLNYLCLFLRIVVYNIYCVVLFLFCLSSSFLSYVVIFSGLSSLIAPSVLTHHLMKLTHKLLTLARNPTTLPQLQG